MKPCMIRRAVVSIFIVVEVAGQSCETAQGEPDTASWSSEPWNNNGFGFEFAANVEAAPPGTLVNVSAVGLSVAFSATGEVSAEATFALWDVSATEPVRIFRSSFNQTVRDGLWTFEQVDPFILLLQRRYLLVAFVDADASPPVEAAVLTNTSSFGVLQPPFEYFGARACTGCSAAGNALPELMEPVDSIYGIDFCYSFTQGRCETIPGYLTLAQQKVVNRSHFDECDAFVSVPECSERCSALGNCTAFDTFASFCCVHVDNTTQEFEPDDRDNGDGCVYLRVAPTPSPVAPFPSPSPTLVPSAPPGQQVVLPIVSPSPTSIFQAQPLATGLIGVVALILLASGGAFGASWAIDEFIFENEAPKVSSQSRVSGENFRGKAEDLHKSKQGANPRSATASRPQPSMSRSAMSVSMSRSVVSTRSYSSSATQAEASTQLPPAHFKVFMVGLLLADSICHWVFVFDRLAEGDAFGDDLTRRYVGYAAVGVMGATLLTNLVLILIVLVREFRFEEVRDWFADNNVAGSTLFLLAFAGIDVLSVLYSRVFFSRLPGNAFNAPFSVKTREQLFAFGVIGNFVEDLPMLGVLVASAVLESLTVIHGVCIAITVLTVLLGAGRRLAFAFLYSDGALPLPAPAVVPTTKAAAEPSKAEAAKANQGGLGTISDVESENYVELHSRSSSRENSRRKEQLNFAESREAKEDFVTTMMKKKRHMKGAASRPASREPSLSRGSRSSLSGAPKKRELSWSAGLGLIAERGTVPDLDESNGVKVQRSGSRRVELVDRVKA